LAIGNVEACYVQDGHGGLMFPKLFPFDDAARAQFATTVAEMLELQMVVSGKRIEDDESRPNRKALGYIYGYIDAALRAIGQDMSKMSVGVPITFQIMHKLWPEHTVEYMDVIARNIGSDDVMMFGIMHGGQQYTDYLKAGSAGAPMGLARFIIDGDNRSVS